MKHLGPDIQLEGGALSRNPGCPDCQSGSPSTTSFELSALVEEAEQSSW